MTELLPIIAEPRRRQIMNLLRDGEQSVSELGDHFNISRPAVSQHLKALLDAGLVNVRKQGRQRLYSLRPDGLAALRAELELYWASEFDDLIDASQNLKAQRLNLSDSVLDNDAADKVTDDGSDEHGK